MENFIFNIILFYFYYFVIPMTLWVDVLLRSYVVIEPHCVLADRTAILLLFFLIIVVL